MPISLSALFSILITSAVLVVCIYIVLEKRQPTSTLAWLFAVLLVPVGGILLYLVLGRQRMVRRRMHKAHLRKKCQQAFKHYIEHSPARRIAIHAMFLQYEPMLRLALHGKVDLSVTLGNRLELLCDGTQTYGAIFEAIQNARQTIHVLFYIIQPDSVGNRLKLLLMQKAREGVTVRLIYDDFGSIRLRRAWVSELRAAGVQIGVFMPMMVPFAGFRMRWSFRNHRKIVVIDDSIGFTGGLNIGEEYEGKNPAIGRWRDTFVRIEGPAVLDLNIVFCEDWLFATDELIEPELVPPLMDDGAIVQIVSSGPDREWEDILIHYFVAITSAKHTCYITTPYFVPVMSIRTALISAAMRGVDVRLLLPGYNDSKILALASHSYYDELIRAGIRIYEFQDGFLHAKTICIDAEYGSVGSANMDPRSLRLSFEINAFIYQTAFARQLHNMFLKDLEHTCEITLNDLIQKRLPRRLAESVVRLASPLL